MLELLTSIDRRLRYLEGVLPVMEVAVPAATPVRCFVLQEPITDHELLERILDLAELAISNAWAHPELVKMLALLTQARDLWLKTNSKEDGKVFVFDDVICLYDPETKQKKVSLSRTAPTAPYPRQATGSEKGIGEIPPGVVTISLERLVELIAWLTRPIHES